MSPQSRKILMLKTQLERLRRKYNYTDLMWKMSVKHEQQLWDTLEKANLTIVDLKKTIRRGGPLGPAPPLDPKYQYAYKAACNFFKSMIKNVSDKDTIVTFLEPIDYNKTPSKTDAVVKWELIKDDGNFIDVTFLGEYTMGTLP